MRKALAVLYGVLVVLLFSWLHEQGMARQQALPRVAEPAEPTGESH